MRIVRNRIRVKCYIMFKKVVRIDEIQKSVKFYKILINNLRFQFGIRSELKYVFLVRL